MVNILTVRVARGRAAATKLLLERARTKRDSKCARRHRRETGGNEYSPHRRDGVVNDDDDDALVD